MLGPLGLELQMDVSCHVSAGNLTQIVFVSDGFQYPSLGLCFLCCDYNMYLGVCFLIFFIWCSASILHLSLYIFPWVWGVFFYDFIGNTHCIF